MIINVNYSSYIHHMSIINYFTILKIFFFRYDQLFHQSISTKYDQFHQPMIEYFDWYVNNMNFPSIYQPIPTYYPLVNVYITMENHHAINGKTHYFYGHFQ